jgi:DNA-binding transcriptional LysR family regulator
MYIKNRPSHLRRAIGFDLCIRQPAKLRPTIAGSLLLSLAKLILDFILAVL